MNQRLVIVYDPTLIRFGSDILKIVAVLVKSDIAFTGVFYRNVNLWEGWIVLSIESCPCPYFTQCFPLQLFDFFGDFTQEK